MQCASLSRHAEDTSEPVRPSKLGRPKFSLIVGLGKKNGSKSNKKQIKDLSSPEGGDDRGMSSKGFLPPAVIKRSTMTGV